MEVTARLRYLRMSPKKVRLVADLIRGKNVNEALTILNLSVKRAAKPLKKLLESAIANAKQTGKMDIDNLYISHLTVDEGPTLKRFRPRAMGRATIIRKRTSHITIKLKEE